MCTSSPCPSNSCCTNLHILERGKCPVAHCISEISACIQRHCQLIHFNVALRVLMHQACCHGSEEHPNARHYCRRQHNGQQRMPAVGGLHVKLTIVHKHVIELQQHHRQQRQTAQRSKAACRCACCALSSCGNMRVRSGTAHTLPTATIDSSHGAGFAVVNRAMSQRRRPQ